MATKYSISHCKTDVFKNPRIADLGGAVLRLVGVKS